MVLYSKKQKSFVVQTFSNSVVRCNSVIKLRRKDILSPPKHHFLHQNTGTFFFAPSKGSLTVEAALVLPFVLFVMITVLQYGCCMETSVKIGAAMSETGKKMALTAYVTRYGGNTTEITGMAAGALSAVYAQQKILSQAGDVSAIKNANMALSSFLQEDEMINLVMTYQIRTPVGIISLPGTFFIQCARVRAWTGRQTGGKDGEQEGTENENSSKEYVYVTITGTVYHEDAECTHLKLSVREVSMSQVAGLRNNNGEIYHICERCGNFGGSTVYITEEGNRFHSSLNCSSLKRTVQKVAKEEISHMRACSKCGG